MPNRMCSLNASMMWWKNYQSKNQERPGLLMPALPLMGCIILDKPFSVSEPQFPCLKNEAVITHASRVLQSSMEIVCRALMTEARAL